MRKTLIFISFILIYIFLCTSVLSSNEEEPTIFFLEKNKVNYVSGIIFIESSPEAVWTVMANPYEFKGRISPKLKSIKVLKDEDTSSVITYKMSTIFPLPDILCTVQSTYLNKRRIEFKRLSGSFRNLEGSWIISPMNKNLVSVTYTTHLDSGFPITEWIVRQGIRLELPGMLKRLKRRIESPSKFKIEKTLRAAI